MNRDGNSYAPSGFLRGALLGGVVGVLASSVVLHNAWPELVALTDLGWDGKTGTRTSTDVLAWTERNLGASIGAFLLVGILYVRALCVARGRIRRGDLTGVMRAAGSLQLWSTSFFGLGVLWTTIGMRDALLFSLGDFGMHGPTGITAYELMYRLVEGGVLTALTTTIVGGAGAYFMNVITHVAVQLPAHTLHATQQRDEYARVMQLLDTLAHRDDPSVTDARPKEAKC